MCDGRYIGGRVVNRYLYLILILFCCSPVWAGYAQVSPAANVSRSAVGQVMVQAAANDVSFGAGAGIRSAAGVINVGGRAVTMPAAYRFAPNAARVAASYAFGNPALILALGVGSLAYGYYKSQDFEVLNGAWWKVEPNRGTQYAFCANCWASSVAAAGSMMDGKDAGNGLTYSFVSAEGTYGRFNLKNAQNEVTGVSFLTASTRVLDTQAISQASKTEFEDAFAPLPLPAGVPQELQIPLPVDDPILNPSPGENPVSQPMRVPQGEPQPVPNSDPQKWQTPVVDIVPSPSISDPFRVDVQPKNIITDNPNSLPDTGPVPVTPPAGQSDDPVTPDLCEKNPDILACQKLDTPESPELEKLEKPISITPLSGWGGENASCPSPRHLNGANIDYSFQPICNFMTSLRPVVIAVAWLAAAFILLGVRQGDA